MPRNVSPLVAMVCAGTVALMIGACSGQVSFGKSNKIDASRKDKKDRRETAIDRIESESDPNRAADINVSLGRGYMEQGQNEVALQKFKRALEISPNLPIAHTAIAVLYERLGADEEAGMHYQKAADLDRKSGVMNNNYGTWLCRRGQLKEADRRFAVALADPFYETPSVALGNRAACALKGGNLDVAESTLEQALKLDPRNGVALLSMAELQFQRKEYFRASAFVQRYETAQKANVDSLILGYRIEQALGKSDAANEYRNRLRRDFPESAQAQSLN